MDWVLASLVSAAVFAVVSVMDKRILAVHVDGMPGFYFLVGLMQFVMAIVAVLVEPWQGASLNTMTMAALSGAITGAGLLCLFYGIRALDVSHAIPIFHTFPVFVTILAVLFLGERVQPAQWFAILMVIAGAGLLAIGPQQSETSGSKRLGILATVIASAGMAGGLVTSKVALEGMSLWNAFAFRSIFLGVVMLLPAIRPSGMRQVADILSNKRALSLIVLTEGVLAGIAVYTMLLALVVGQASIASTLMSTRPAFVLVFSALLSTRIWKLLDEPLTRDTMALKSGSTAIVIVGVGILALT